MPGSLRVGYAQEAPYSFLSNSRVTGESPELFRMVTDSLGIHELQWIPLEFDGLIPALLDGRIDVVAAGLFRTPTRMERVRFTRPTFCVDLYAVGMGKWVELRHETRLPSLNPPLRAGVLSGGAEERHIQNTVEAKVEVVHVPDVTTARAGLLGGNLDLFFISGPTARAMVAEDTTGHLELLGPFPTETDGSGTETPLPYGCGGFAFRPQDSQLANQVDRVLEQLVGSPEHLETVSPFGFEARELQP